MGNVVPLYAEKEAITCGRWSMSRFVPWLRRLVRSAAHGIGLPGMIRPAEINDHVTGQHVVVSVNRTYVVIRVDGRDYYFDRLSGRFDGTGMGCRA